MAVIDRELTNGGRGAHRGHQSDREHSMGGRLPRPGLDHREGEADVMKHHVNGDVQVIFAGEAYLRNLGYLIGQYAAFASSEIGWSANYSRRMAQRGLGVEDIVGSVKLNADTISLIMKNHDMERRIPSAILFRAEDAEPGNYLAMSAQRMFFPRIRLEGQPEREEPVLYHILRAIRGEERGNKRGRAMVESALMLHRSARWFTHRTGYDLAAYVNTQSEALDQDNAYPWTPREPGVRPFTDSPVAWAIEQEMSRILGNPVPVDEWGICRDLYPEANVNVDTQKEPKHPKRARVWTFMYKTQQMTTKDGILPLYRRK